jgi:hypothetical protein
MEAKTATFHTVRTFAGPGKAATAPPLWAAAASDDERLAPLQDALGRQRGAAARHSSAASCCHKRGDVGRAVNLYQAGLAAVLHRNTRRDVEALLAARLDERGRRPRAAQHDEEAR